MRILTDLNDPHPMLDAFRHRKVQTVHVSDVTPNELEKEFLLFFADVFGFLSKHPFRFRTLKQKLNAKGTPVIAWNRDAPWNCDIKPWRKPFIKPLGLIDIYLAHSLQGATDFANCFHYFPNAADTLRYTLAGRSLNDLRQPEGYRVDVAFYGSLNPGFKRVRTRTRFLKELAERLQRSGITTEIRDSDSGPGLLTTAQQIAQIQTSRINLNVGAVCDDKELSWGLPERCYGVPACGGFLLCDYRRHAVDTFSVDLWADYTDMDDCLSKIRYYLDHFPEARQKAERLHTFVMSNHTYSHRVESILNLSEMWRAGRR